MHNDKSDYFDFTFGGDSGETSAAGSGGGAGKTSPPDLTFVKYTDSDGEIGDLSGMPGGSGATIPLLLPAVQQAREAAISELETAFDELRTGPSAEAWDDWFLG